MGRLRQRHERGRAGHHAVRGRHGRAPRGRARPRELPAAAVGRPQLWPGGPRGRPSQTISGLVVNPIILYTTLCSMTLLGGARRTHPLYPTLTAERATRAWTSRAWPTWRCSAARWWTAPARRTRPARCWRRGRRRRARRSRRPSCSAAPRAAPAWGRPAVARAAGSATCLWVARSRAARRPMHTARARWSHEHTARAQEGRGLLPGMHPALPVCRRRSSW